MARERSERDSVEPVFVPDDRQIDFRCEHHKVGRFHKGGEYSGHALLIKHRQGRQTRNAGGGAGQGK